MIRHYMKMAFRSLMKYKTQNVISISGIAVGFVCFAFSMIWIKYELGYDNFHRGADRVYVLYEESAHDYSGYSHDMHFSTANKIKNLFPEIEDVSSFTHRSSAVGRTSDGNIEVMEIAMDSSFVSMFDVKLIDGSLSFIDNESEVAITEEAAIRVFGTTDVMGKDLYFYHLKQAKRISAIISGFGRHSNFSYDIMTGVGKDRKSNIYNSDYKVCFRLKEGVDCYAFAGKLKATDVYNAEFGTVDKGYLMEKLTSCRYTIFHDDNNISLMYIKLFSFIGVLVVLVSLVNFFSILVTRVNIRKREIALRVSCGSGMGSLVYMFVAELVIMMFAGGVLGIVLMELLESKFVELSGVESGFYVSSFLYFAVLLLLSVCVSLVIIRYHARLSISEVLGKRMMGKTDNIVFQSGSIILQFVISALVLFGISIVFKQLYYLSNTDDVGFERKGRATVKVFPQNEEIIHFIKGLPYVYEVKKMYSLFPQSAKVSIRANSWDGKQETQEPVILHMIDEGQEFMDFYGLELVQGSNLQEQGDVKSAIINETAAKRFGWKEPIGKKFMDYTVAGVVKDFHISSPTLPVQPFFLTLQSDFSMSDNILVRYDENHEKDLRKEVETYFSKNGCSPFSSFTTASDEYEKYLKSERSLMALLSFVATVCVIISLFGVYSHVSLTCERRRKEMAIRKINGATVRVIMNMFINRYLYMLAGACVVAFPVGTLLMKKWLEQYVEQTSIGASLYVLIFFVLLLLVLLCVARNVWITAHANPSEVIKNE